MFDFSFTQFVTIKFVKIIYIIFIIMHAFLWLFMILAGLAGFADSFGLGLLGLLGGIIFGGILFIIGVIGARVALEFYVSMVRTAQNTGELVEQNKKL
uniref:DUF4282 domain-containing protein n=1 Tax=Corynebacterium cystitidis TaxID=35757 RepID=UPI00358DB92F